MKPKEKRPDRSLLAAVLLLALQLLWLLNLIWGALLAGSYRSTQWPIHADRYELEVITQDEFEKLKDRSVREITFADGRKFVRTPDWHPLFLAYYKPIDDGERFVRLTVHDSVFAELRNTDAVKLTIVTVPALVLSFWILAIAVRRRFEDAAAVPLEQPATRHHEPAAEEIASSNVPPAVADSRQVAQVPRRASLLSRTAFGVGLIVLSLVLGVVVHMTWGQVGGLFGLLSLYVIAPFSLIGLCAFITKRSTGALVGAAFGCFLVIAPTFGLLIYDTFFAPPTGANIGLGLLLIALPVIATFAGLMGALIGSELGRVLGRR